MVNGFLCLVAVLCAGSVLAAEGAIQVGHNFPNGVQLGASSGSPSCNASEVGTLRFSPVGSGTIELCTNAGAWTQVAQTGENLSPTSVQLHQRMVFCSGHGTFNPVDGTCACDFDEVNGFHLGQFCFTCIGNYSKDANGACTIPDQDGDGISDNDDNCVLFANPEQVDSDSNGHGDACDFLATCKQYKIANASATSGYYTVDIDGPAGPKYPFEVYCDMSSDGGGWTMFQKRDHDGVTFHDKLWHEYKSGFGVRGSYWMGNDRLSNLIGPSGAVSPFAQLRLTTSVDPDDVSSLPDPSVLDEGLDVVAQYTTFAVNDESDQYRLYVQNYEGGNYGDSLISRHHGMMFSTPDRDNDERPASNCASDLYPGGWWYKNCYAVFFNGEFLPGPFPSGQPQWTAIHWSAVLSNGLFGLASSEMGFRESVCHQPTKGGCDHNCHIDELDYYCSCDSGYFMNPDNHTCTGPLASCMEIRDDDRYNHGSGTYWIDVDGSGPVERMEVYCDMDTDGGGWTVLQRRFDGSEIFHTRTWNEYRDGFGSVSGEYWVGNEHMKELTSAMDVEVRFDVTIDSAVNTAGHPEFGYAVYRSFHVDDEASKYTLTIGSYSFADDDNILPNEMPEHNGMQFSAIDQDNDQRSGGSPSCALDLYPGGWWFNNCYRAFLNGEYISGQFPSGQDHWTAIHWVNWIPNHERFGLSSSKMMVRESPCTSNNGGCDHHCHTDSGTERHCSCQRGYVLDADNTTCVGPLKSCMEIRDDPAYNLGSGRYNIDPDGNGTIGVFEVNCDMDTDNGGWIVFQNRFDGSVTFHDKNWASYRDGFGKLNGEFWLGNDHLYELTSSLQMELRVDVGIDPSVNTISHAPDGFAVYRQFAVGNEASNYVLTAASFSFSDFPGALTESMSTQHGMMFSTPDRDNDLRTSSGSSSCARDLYPGGWWYRNCYSCFLNGEHLSGVFPSGKGAWTGMHWSPWLNEGGLFGLSTSSMKMRESPCTLSNGGCSQHCHTVDSASRFCSCSSGYILDGDGVTCNAI